MLVDGEYIFKRSNAGLAQPMLPSKENVSGERLLFGARHNSHNDAVPIRIPFIVLYDNDRPASTLASISFASQVGIENISSPWLQRLTGSPPAHAHRPRPFLLVRRLRLPAVPKSRPAGR